MGNGDSLVVRAYTCDGKVPSSSPGRSKGRIVFSGVSFLCWLLFPYPFHPCVTAVACEGSRLICQKCRWQVTAKQTYTLPMWFWMKWHCEVVCGWMVVSCGTSHATTKECYQYTTSVDMKNMCYKRIQSLIQNHMWHDVRSESAREQRMVLIKAMNNNVTGNVFPLLPRSGCQLPECNSVSGGVQPVCADPLQWEARAHLQLYSSQHSVSANTKYICGLCSKAVYEVLAWGFCSKSQNGGPFYFLAHPRWTFCAWAGLA